MSRVSRCSPADIGAMMSGAWKFDAAVAAGFASHAQQHIPDYTAVLDQAVRLAQASCSADDAILEVGCAAGETLRRLHDAGFSNLTGVDNSPDMLARCDSRHARLVLSDTFPHEHAPYQLVLANWTLHFIPVERRTAYFAAIYRGLREGGYLMLSEKCVQSDAMMNLYHGWKRDGGLSQQAIDSKARSLEGVLVPMAVSWNIGQLEKLGFAVDIWRAASGFVTFLARKPPSQA